MSRRRDVAWVEIAWIAYTRNDHLAKDCLAWEVVKTRTEERRGVYYWFGPCQ